MKKHTTFPPQSRLTISVDQSEAVDSNTLVMKMWNYLVDVLCLIRDLFLIFFFVIQTPASEIEQMENDT